VVFYIPIITTFTDKFKKLGPSPATKQIIREGNKTLPGQHCSGNTVLWMIQNLSTSCITVKVVTLTVHLSETY